MYLNQLSAKTGYLWFCKGIQLFCRHPLKALSIFLTYFFAMMLLSLPPVLGTVLPLLLLPGLSVGFMLAGRTLAANQPFPPLALLTGFRDFDSTVRQRLLILGALYIVATFATLALSSLVDGGMLMRLVLGRAPSDPQLLIQSALPRAVLIAMVAYIPIAALFWFAPTLVAWHRFEPHKALFLSALGCWRNRGAFVVYVLLWVTLVLMVSSTLTLLLYLFGLKTLATVMIMPLSLILTSMFYCSFYLTYESCFSEKVA